MRSVLIVVFCLFGSVAASATELCPGNPDALGTSRVLTIEPADFARIGSMQYPKTLPLEDHEVVITFDDGPIPPFTNAVLDTLASECVKATYFLVGEMARAYPSIVRRIYNAGHAIGTHSQNHPYRFQRLSLEKAESQVDSGIASVDAALGDPKALSPFFRIPGLGRTDALEGLSRFQIAYHLERGRRRRRLEAHQRQRDCPPRDATTRGKGSRHSAAA
jgi:peptidoglycan/xylan/chitin deacetylase (PgdA/CDA1 family)